MFRVIGSKIVKNSILNCGLGAPRNYVHRVGRTARAGRKGTSITMMSPYDTERVLAIEKIVNSKMSEFPLEEDKIVAILTRLYHNHPL